MKKVYQSRIGKNGNCFEACLASILETPLKKIPSTHFHQENWLDKYIDFLKPHNMSLVACHDLYDVPRGWAIGVFNTGKTFDHAVVCYDGTKRHNPTPLKYRPRMKRLGKLDYWIVLTILDPTKIKII